jgi:hypothetical protein
LSIFSCLPDSGEIFKWLFYGRKIWKMPETIWQFLILPCKHKLNIWDFASCSPFILMLSPRNRPDNLEKVTLDYGRGFKFVDNSKVTKTTFYLSLNFPYTK